MPIFVTAASNAMAGNLDVAANAMQRLRELDPNFRVHKVKDPPSAQTTPGTRMVGRCPT
jgi:hypothetical protein